MIHTVDALADYGLGFTLAKTAQKVPFYKQWQKTPKTADEAKAHRGNVGVLLGEYAGRRWAAVDVDDRFAEFLRTFPQLAASLRSWRDNADGGKVIVELVDELPPNATWGQDGQHAGADLLASGKHAIVAGVHPSGAPYRMHLARPVRLTLAELTAIWLQWTGQQLARRKPKAQPAPTPRPRAAGDGEGLEALRRHWTAYAVFAHFGKAGEIHQEGQDLRLAGHAGLLVGDPNGPEAWRWYWHGEDAGGDQFDAWAHLTGRKLPVDFPTVAQEMADAAGITLPTPEERRAAAGDQIAWLRAWAHEQPFADLLTHRTANGQYRTYAADLAAFDAVLEIFGAYGKLFGPVSAAQIATRINAGVNSAASALDRLCTGLLVRVETQRPENGAYSYQVAARLVDLAAGAVRRSRVNTSQTEDHARSTHKAYSDHRADDAFCQSMTAITPDQYGERIAAGQLYAANYRSVLERRLAAAVPSAGRMVLVLLDELVTAGGAVATKDLHGRRGLNRYSWRRAINRAVDLSLVDEDGARLTLRGDWEAWIRKLEPEMPTYGARLRREAAECDRKEKACNRALARHGGAMPPEWVLRWQEQIAHRRPHLDRAAVAYQVRMAAITPAADVARLIDPQRRSVPPALAPVASYWQRLTPTGKVHTGRNRLLHHETPGYLPPEDIYNDEELDLLADLAYYRQQAYAAA